MKIQVYEIDINGYAVMLNNELPFNQRNVSALYLEDDEEIPEGYVKVPDTTIKQLWLPKWTGTEWIEGLIQEEIYNLNNQPRELTDKERIAQLEEIIDVMLTGGAI